MSDVEVKVAEVVPEPNALALMVKEQDRPVLGVVEALNNLDWREMKPPHIALLLMQKPFQVSGGGVQFLTFKQAIFFATRCYELGVSPFSSEVWFDPQRFSVNLTLEGKRAVARNKGIDLGPPSFEEVYRDWKDVPRITTAAEEAKKAGFTKDVGIKCSMRVGDPKFNEIVNYTAWLSEWYVGKSFVWKEKPTHMLSTRACEKAISLALGTGASAMPSEEEIGG